MFASEISVLAAARCTPSTNSASTVRSAATNATEQATGLLFVRCPTGGFSIEFSIDDEFDRIYRCGYQIRLEPGEHHLNLNGPFFSVTVPAGQRITLGMVELEHGC